MSIQSTNSNIDLMDFTLLHQSTLAYTSLRKQTQARRSSRRTFPIDATYCSNEGACLVQHLKSISGTCKVRARCDGRVSICAHGIVD